MLTKMKLLYANKSCFANNIVLCHSILSAINYQKQITCYSSVFRWAADNYFTGKIPDSEMLHIGRPTRVLFSGRVACRSTSTSGKGRGPSHQPYPIASFYHARTHGERSPPLPRADARRALPASGGHGSRAGGQAIRLDAPPLLQSRARASSSSQIDHRLRRRAAGRMAPAEQRPTAARGRAGGARAEGGGARRGGGRGRRLRQAGPLLPPRAGAGELLPRPRERAAELDCRCGRIRRGSLLLCSCLFFVVAIVAYWCCNNILGMLQSFVVHVAIVVNMLRPCSLLLRLSHTNVSKLGLIFFMLRILILDVADVESRCFSNTWYWMLQILIFDVADVVCDVGCCVDC
jgi:hypothetical protein